ncbi:MAG: hypothetical protein KDD41_06865 [Flavobacteriales bacterium]|nr:hypothetical protein [Flavobacteriales bacterium]
MKKHIWHSVFMVVALLFVVMPDQAVAQWALDINGSVKKEETNKRFEGVTITVKRNGSVWKTISTPADGKFDLSLPPDGIYLIEFSRPNHVTKRIEFSTKNVPPEDAKYGFEFPMEMNLFEKIDGLDVSILDKPIAKVAFDPSTGYMDYDPEYTKSVQKELERLKKELEERLKAKEAERKAKQKDYDAAIAAADKLFNSEKWTEAKPLYEKASNIFPDESYPLFQLGEIEDKLAGLEEMNKRYQAAIDKGDAAFKEREWEKAINAYEIALEVKEADYPKNKIKEVEDIMKNEEKVNEQYKDAIAAADAAFDDKSYDKAKENYQKAATLKSYEDYPKQRLTEIDKILAELAAKEKEYKDALAEADNLFNAKDYEKSIPAYTKASGIKPDESYPKERIEEATAKLAEQKALEERYKALIADADDAFGTKSYEEAQSKYEEASELKSNEQYPKDKINEIKSILAASKKLEEDYAAVIEQGDLAFSGEKYEEAKVAYEKALTLKAKEQYPKDKIEEIKAKLEALQAQKALDEKYNALIASADAAFGSKNYDKAKTDYEAAKKVKPAETYPPEKIAEIEGILAEQDRINREYADAIKDGDIAFTDKEYEKARSFFEKALELKPAEQYPKDKLAAIKIKIDEQLANMQLDEKYNALIKSADFAFENEKYENAKADYNAALGVKPAEKYPKDQLKAIEDKLAQLKKEEENALAAEAARKKREYYEAVIAQADAEFTAQNYQVATQKYTEASAIMPDESYPKEKIKEIEKLLADLAAKNAANEAAALAQKQLDEKYNALIASADGAFNAEAYEKAKTDYKAALALKPSESYPAERIKEIDALLAAQKAKEEEIKVMSNAMKQKQQQYDSYIALGDQNFGSKQYKLAKSNYEMAIGIMPNEQYPKDRIKEIESILADLAMKEKQDRDAAQAEKEKREAYEKLIYEGDRAMKTEEYRIAQSNFNAALNLYPDEKYPSDMLVKIAELLNKKQEVKEEEVVEVTPGMRKKITDAKEKEIERMMQKIRNKVDAQKDEALAKEKEEYLKQQEVRVTSNLDRIEKNQEELDGYADNIEAMQKRGNTYHLKNSADLMATTEQLKKAEEKRIKSADKKREEAGKELDDYQKEWKKFQAEQEKLSAKKAVQHYSYVDDILEARESMIERGDKVRAKNQKDLDKLAADTKKNKERSNERAIKKQIDVNEYKAKIAAENQILVKASIERTADNQKELDELNADMIAQRKKGDQHYKVNVGELMKFRDRIQELEAKRIAQADKARMANNKDKEKMQQQIQKNQEKQLKKYYKDVKVLDKYKQSVAKENSKRVKDADKRRELADKELEDQKEAMKSIATSQEPRYKEFDKQLEKVRKANMDFYADLSANQDKKILMADSEIRDVYRGELKPRQNNDLAAKYPQGITEEVVESGSSVTIKRLKVTGDQVDVYERVFYPWGGTYYFKNGTNITKSLWDKESIEK